MSRVTDLTAKWLAHPRILRLFDSAVVERALVGLVRLPTELSGLREHCGVAVARALGFATSDQALRLERAVHRLEQDLDRLKSRSVDR